MNVYEDYGFMGNPYEDYEFMALCCNLSNDHEWNKAVIDMLIKRKPNLTKEDIEREFSISPLDDMENFEPLHIRLKRISDEKNKAQRSVSSPSS